MTAILHPMLRWTLFAALLVAAPACGGDDGDASADAAIDCSLVTDVDVYSPGLEKVGDNGYTVRIMDAQPAPPSRGDNVWTLSILDPSSAAANDLKITNETWMPKHMHGSPIFGASDPTGNAGEYDFGSVNLFMPGIWEVTIIVNEKNPDDTVGDELDRVLFTLCVDA